MWPGHSHSLKKTPHDVVGLRCHQVANQGKPDDNIRVPVSSPGPQPFPINNKRGAKYESTHKHSMSNPATITQTKKNANKHGRERETHRIRTEPPKPPGCSVHRVPLFFLTLGRFVRALISFGSLDRRGGCNFFIFKGGG